MVKHCGIVRNGESMQKGLNKLEAIMEKINDAAYTSPAMIELYNMALVSKSILVSAIARKDSVGAHYRED